MVSIVSDLAKSNLEKLINATIEESRYICCFTCITDDFEKERENLIAKKETWEEYARVATRKGDNIRKDVTHWQKQAKELIEEDTKRKTKCFFGWCPNCIWQYSRGKELESKTEKIKRLMKCSFENVGISRDVPDIEYHSSQNYISFESRKLKFEEIINALKDDNNYMIGLQGMGGTGKTTLAKEVGKELKKSKCFNQVIDTTISNTPDIKKIQDDIAGPLGLSLTDYTESERPRKLKDRLTNGEKILLILDDVWGDINFEEIGIPFKDDHNNCRILVTTRNMKICQQMECDKTIKLDNLPDEEGWILFQKYAGLTDKSSKSILHKGRKISKECKGLPIAIAVIARSLKGPRPLEEWDVALKSLQKSMHVHDDEDESWRKVYTCLKYSYDNMKDETAKKLFLLCSLFREDEEISEEILVRLAKGATLIEKIDDDYSYDEYRKKVIVEKYKLTDSCLLLNCESEGVKMHDLVREMALSIANKEIVAVNTSNKNELTMIEKGKNIKYLLCEGKSNDLFSSKFDGSKLDILIVYMNNDGPVEIPNSFFENIPGLQVLILSNNKRAILSLPQSIQLLTNIKSLYLKNFSLGDISILGNLHALETLELVECEMDELPREIVKLVKLKLLKLKYCYFERCNVFEVIKSCSSLEELHLITTYNYKIFKDCHLELPNYQRFCIGEHDECFRDIYYPEWFLRNSLDVDNPMEIFSEETLKNLVQKAEILRLRGPIGVWKNLIPDIIFPEDESTSNLMEIALEDNSELTFLIDNNDSLVQQSALSRLVTLQLKGMKNLKEICNGPLPSELLKNLETICLYNCNHLQGALFKSKISLFNLKYLFISKCPMLTSLFELSTTQSLLSLETLSIYSCEQLKSIIRDENKWKDSGEEIVDTHNDNMSTISIFPNLTTLAVEECRLLQFVLPVTQKIPKLEVIAIVGCDRLKYLFGRYQHEYEEEDLHQELKDVIFTSVKEVYVLNLPNFVDIFQKCDESLCSLVKKSISKDETKGKIESKSITYKVLHWTHKYKNKWRTTKIPFDSKDQLQESSLPMVNEPNANDVIAQEMGVKLENLSLNDTSKILFTLQNVTVLYIESCEKVEVLFCASMLECLPYLGALKIYRCNELKQIIGEDAKNQRKPFFPRLKALIIRECNKLKCIFPISTSEMVPMLEALLIMEASMLEEVFEGNSDEMVQIPNLKTAGFVELPSLRQKIEFLTVKHCLVRNCPKLYISPFPQDLKDFSYSMAYSMAEYFKDQDLDNSIRRALDDLKPEEIRNENPRREDSAIGTEVEAASFKGQNNANHSTLAKIDEDNKQHEDVVKESTERVEEEQQIVVGKASSMPISPTDFPLHKTHSPEKEEEEEEMAIPSNLNTEPPITKDVNDGDFQGTSNSEVTNSQNTNSTEATDQRIKKILTEIADDLDEDSKTTEIRSQNEMTKAKEDFSIDAKAEVLSGTDFTSSQETKKTCEDGTTSPYEKTIMLSTDSESEHGETQISVPFSVVNIELETTEDVGVGDIQEASPEKLDEITQDSSSVYTVRRELEQLVSKKHLGSENLALLSNFLVKHPSLRLADDAMSERYKGFAYTCLAELLKFLQSHSVYDMLGSSHSEFVELLKELRNCGFNKDWLDDVERLKTVL